MEFFRKINLQDYDGILEVNKFTRSFKTSTSELYQHILVSKKGYGCKRTWAPIQHYIINPFSREWWKHFNSDGSITIKRTNCFSSSHWTKIKRPQVERNLVLACERHKNVELICSFFFSNNICWWKSCLGLGKAQQM
jgi:hypothetical protein